MIKALYTALIIFVATNPAHSQRQTEFGTLLLEANREIENGFIPTEYLVLYGELIDKYMTATILRQIHLSGIAPDKSEIYEGRKLLGLLHDPRYLYWVKSNSYAVDINTLDKIDNSFQRRRSGYENVLEDILILYDVPRSELEPKLLRALAFFAIVSAIDANQSQFRRGEFCILPFWPFC